MEERGNAMNATDAGQTPERREVSDAKEWSGTHGKPWHYHRFNSDLKAMCNRGITSRARRFKVSGELLGHDELRTRSEIENSKYAHLNTFCAKCEAKR